MGLLDGFKMPDMDSPQGQGLLAAAFSLMQAKGPSLGNAIGSAGSDYMRTYGASKSQMDADKLNKMRMEQAQMQLAKAKADAESEALFNAGVGKFFKPGAAALPPLMGDPSIGMMPSQGREAVAPSIDRQGLGMFMAQNGRLKDGMELMTPKDVEFSTAPQYDQNGRAFILGKDGSIKYLDGVKARDKLIETDLGGTKGFRTEYSPTLLAQLPKTQSPDSRASNALGWANNSLSRERMNFDKTGGAEGGKPQLVDGQWVYKPDAQNPQGRVTPVNGFNKPMTDSQSKANLFGTRAIEAENAIQSAGSGDYGKRNGADRPGLIKRAAEGTLGMVPFAGNALADVAGTLTNWTQSENQQKVEQAQRDFINAILRRESGAVIGIDEFTNAKKQYFPQIGDGEKVLAQKAKNRKTAISGIMEEVPASTRQKAPALSSPGAPKFLGFED